MVLLLISIMAVISCAGLPQRSEKVQCLLVIPVQVGKKGTTRSPYIKYELFLEGRERPVVVDPSAGDAVVKELPPGDYRFISVQNRYKTSSYTTAGTAGNSWRTSIAFRLEEGRITVLDRVLAVTMTQTGTSYNQSVRFRALVPPDMTRIRQELEKNLDGWELVFPR
jgi:hypothetical protein